MKTIQILLMIVCLFACSDNSNKRPRYDAYCEACGVISPQDNLEWLHKKITDAEILFRDERQISMYNIYLTEYKGKDVFLILHSSVLTFDDMYDCQGNMIELTIEDKEEVVNDKRKWICIYDFVRQNP